MPQNTMFATGVVNDPRLHSEMVRWVAQRGGIHDWAVYFDLEHYSIGEVKATGCKIITEDVIRSLVPCTDEALQMYRR